MPAHRVSLTVCPAPAGMSPGWDRGQLDLVRLPRTRGDEPQALARYNAGV